MKIMRKRTIKALTAMLAALLLASALALPAAAYSPPASVVDALSARAAIVVSIGDKDEDDVVVYENNADELRAPAAMIRLMVGLTAAELAREKSIDLQTATGVFTRSKFNLYSGTGLTEAGLKYDEEWTLYDLLAVSMIHTAADACVTLAVDLAGSESEFVNKMNDMAVSLGLSNTSYANVTGLDAPGQKTTARDMATLLKRAAEDPMLLKMMEAKSHTGKDVKTGTTRTVANTNSMMRGSESAYYEPVQYGKTGRTSEAKSCLASVAKKDGFTYLCVVMGSEGSSDHFADTKALYEWAFKNLTYKTLLSRELPLREIKVELSWSRDTLRLFPEKDLAAIVPRDLDENTIIQKVELTADSTAAPVKQGDVFGTVKLYVETDRLIGECNLVAGETIEQSEMLVIWSRFQSFVSSPWFIGGVLLLAALIIVYVILNIVHNRRRRKKKMKKVAKRR